MSSLLTSYEFNYLADKILNYTVLMINGKIHRICEIEFYLNCTEHPDLYVHSHIDQTNKGTWYFHRYNNGTYKSGTYKGLDIVLGDKNIYFGILIRSIYDVENKIFIEGPCKTVNHILSLYNLSTIDMLTNGKSLNILNNDKGLVLVEGNPTELEKIKIGPRIGLSDKYPEYKNKKYRYVIGNVKKDKKSLQYM
jgi:3-methyladenine DNA glycosylase Mpg